MSKPEREQLERDIKLAAAEPIEIRALGRNVRVAPIFVYLVGAIIIGVAAGQVIGGGLAMIAVIFGVSLCLMRGGLARSEGSNGAPRPSRGIGATHATPLPRGTFVERLENIAALVMVGLGILLMVLAALRAPYNVRNDLGTALLVAGVVWLALWGTR